MNHTKPLATMSFQDLVVDIMNKTFMGSVLALTHDLDILQSLVDTPQTSVQVARTYGLKERYVREALNCLVCARVLETARNKDGTLVYSLPKGAGDVLDKTDIHNLCLLPTQMARYTKIKDCLLENGPVGYQLNADPLAQACFKKNTDYRLSTDVDVVLREIPGIQEKLNKGISVIEFGSGSGLYLSLFASMFPASTFHGSEVTIEGVNLCKQMTSHKNLPNLHFSQIDMFNVPEDHSEKYDLALICLVLHDLQNPTRGLKGCLPVLKKGGYLMILDVDSNRDVLANRAAGPTLAMHYAFSLFHCIPQTYDGSNVEALGCCWGTDTAIECVREAGFEVVKIVRNHNMEYCVLICKA